MSPSVSVTVLLAVFAISNTEAAVGLKRTPMSMSSFDSLGGMGLGKRAGGGYNPFWLGNSDNENPEKRSLSSFDTLGGIGLGKRSNEEDVKRALSSFDTLGGIGLGKRSGGPFMDEKRAAISAFDSLGGIGLGKRSF